MQEDTQLGTHDVDAGFFAQHGITSLTHEEGGEFCEMGFEGILHAAGVEVVHILPRAPTVIRTSSTSSVRLNGNAYIASDLLVIEGCGIPSASTAIFTTNDDLIKESATGLWIQTRAWPTLGMS